MNNIDRNDNDVVIKSAEEFILTKRYDDALALCRKIIETDRTTLAKAKAYIIMSEIYYQKFDIENHLEYGKAGLALLGEKMPEGYFAIFINLLREILVRFMRHILHSKPSISENAETYRLIYRFYNKYHLKKFLSDAEILRSNIRLLNITEKNIGVSVELCRSCSTFGLVCAGLNRKWLAFTYVDKAISIAKENGDPAVISECLMYKIVLNQACAQAVQNAILFEEFLYYCRISKNESGIISLYSGLTMHYYYFSEYEKSEAAYREGLLHAVDPAQKAILGIWGYPFSLIECGKYDEANRLLEEQKRFIKDNIHPLMQINIPFQAGYLYLEKRQYDLALERLKEAETNFSKIKFIPLLLHYIYVYMVEALIGKYNSEQPNESDRQDILEEIRRYSRIALRHTSRYPFAAADLGGALYAYAEYLSLTSGQQLANRYYVKSIEANIRNRRPFEEAKTRYRFGLHLKKNGDFDGARRELAVAYGIFTRINVGHYASRILNEYGLDEQFRARIIFATPAEYRERLQTLMNLIHRVGAAKDAAEITELTTQAILDTAEGAHVDVIDFGSGNSLLQKSISAQKPELQNALARANTTGTAVISESDSPGGTASILIVPIKAGNSISGVFYLNRPLSLGAFTFELAETISSIAGVASMALAQLSATSPRTAESAGQEDNRARVSTFAVEKLKLVKSYIGLHFHEPGLRSTIARIASMSPDHLGKLFKSCESVSIGEYINRLRIDEARRKIETTNDKIINIAFAVGFENISTFNRLFLRYTGRKPSSIRNQSE